MTVRNLFCVAVGWFVLSTVLLPPPLPPYRIHTMDGSFCWQEPDACESMDFCRRGLLLLCEKREYFKWFGVLLLLWQKKTIFQGNLSILLREPLKNKKKTCNSSWNCSADSLAPTYMPARNYYTTTTQAWWRGGARKKGTLYGKIKIIWRFEVNFCLWEIAREILFIFGSETNCRCLFSVWKINCFRSRFWNVIGSPFLSVSQNGFLFPWETCNLYLFRIIFRYQGFPICYIAGGWYCLCVISLGWLLVLYSLYIAFL